MDLEGARSRIRERSELKAFIAVSHEHGNGDVVAVKDLVDVAGMVTTAGGVILPDTAAEDDAPVIARLRKVGCVVVGKANLHEFAYGVTSLNPHYGNVLNPHDPSRASPSPRYSTLPRIPFSESLVAGKFEPQAMRSAPKRSISVRKNVCGE